MASNSEELLTEISEIVAKEVDKNRKNIQKFLPHLAVGEEEYRKLMVTEVVREVMVDAQFAFPPWENHTPGDVKKKALNTFRKKLERDERLYLAS